MRLGVQGPLVRFLFWERQEAWLLLAKVNKSPWSMGAGDRGLRRDPGDRRRARH